MTDRVNLDFEDGKLFIRADYDNESYIEPMKKYPVSHMRIQGNQNIYVFATVRLDGKNTSMFTKLHGSPHLKGRDFELINVNGDNVSAEMAVKMGVTCPTGGSL